MKRQFCESHGRDSELADEELFECTHPDSYESKASSINSLVINSCCRKCKSCYRHLNSLNPRPNDVALRLKEKSKKKREAFENLQKTEKTETSSRHSVPKHSHTRAGTEDAATMNLDDSDECAHPLHAHTASGNSRQSKSRTSSNNSSASGQTGNSEEYCTLKFDCRCKTCLQRQKLCEELIAEEERESSKKKKAKKKKKKNAKKNQDAVEDELDDAEVESKQRPDTEDEDSHGGKNVNSTVVDPTSIDINQWIKVKNKFSVVKPSSATTSKSATSNMSSSSTSSGPPGLQDHDEMESNGFKLIGGGKDGVDKRRGSNLDAVTKELDAISLGDGKPSAATSNIMKAKLLAIDANMAYLRGEIYDAIHLITECIECDNKSPAYYINRSYYYERSKDYANALADAETAIGLEESTEEYLEYSLYRKAKALSGLNRFELVEPVLKSIIKLLSVKCKNANGHTFSSLVIKIEKDLMINRLKMLVSADYTLPLARLYAAKFDSIQTALDALDQNSRLLEGANESCLNLQMHLQLINGQLQKAKGSSASGTSKDSILLSSNIKHTEKSASTKTVVSNNINTTTTSAAHPDLWNFNEVNDIDVRLGNLLGNDCNDPKSRLDEEAFLSDFDDDDNDSEIYFSDEDEYEMVYSQPERWNSPKDILQLSSGQDHFFTDELRDPINSKGQKALWIGNVSPNCSITLVSHVFMKFGSVTFCKIFPNERINDVAYLLLHYDNDISPRLVMAYFKDKVIPGISKDDLPLIIRFRNKNDKAEEGESMGLSTLGSSASAQSIGSQQAPSFHIGGSSHSSGSTIGSGVAGVNKQPIASECYYWRTTGCDRERCSYKHIPAHRGIDKQSWMRRKN